MTRSLSKLVRSYSRWMRARDLRETLYARFLDLARVARAVRRRAGKVLR